MFRGPSFIVSTMQEETTPFFKRLWYDWTQQQPGIEPTDPLGLCWVPPIVAFYDQQGLLRTYSLPGGSIRSPHPGSPQGGPLLVAFYDKQGILRVYSIDEKGNLKPRLKSALYYVLKAFAKIMRGSFLMEVGAPSGAPTPDPHGVTPILSHGHSFMECHSHFRSSATFSDCQIPVKVLHHVRKASAMPPGRRDPLSESSAGHQLSAPPISSHCLFEWPTPIPDHQHHLILSAVTYCQRWNLTVLSIVLRNVPA